MKRVVCLLLSAALLLGALNGCRRDEPSGPASEEHTARELVEAALLTSGYDGSGGDLEYLTTADNTEEVQGEDGLTVYFGKEVLNVYLENAYGIFSAELPWEDAVVVRATGASAFELAILRMGDEGAAVRAATSLMSYISNRQGDFAGYAPDQANMVANGGLIQKGPYAGLFICPNPDGARAAAETVLDGKPLPGQPGVQEIVSGVKELRDVLVENRGMEPEALELLDDSDSEALGAYLKDAYGLDLEQVEECAVARGTGESAFEVAVVRVRAAVGDVEQKLNAYLNNRETQFDAASEQGELLHRAIVIVASPYVVLLSCQGVEEAAGVFADVSGAMGYGYSARHPYPDTDAAYPDRCVFTPPGGDDMSLYDTAAIRAAWERGDPSGLSKEDRRIYNEAEKVLRKVLRDGMSDYEKEKAVYEWVVNNVNYDWTHQDVMKKTPRESFTPYGGLVNHTAVCLGYAATFQLLCDLAGVECITVVGAAFSSQEDHGWNMVRLNGQWYCLDATWDANYRESGRRRGQEYWSYFNVTSDYMADTDHQWDYANTPEATAADQGRG